MVAEKALSRKLPALPHAFFLPVYNKPGTAAKSRMAAGLC